MSVNTEVKRGRGRPAGRNQDKILHMRVGDEFLAKLDSWRERLPDQPGRTEALRRALDIAAKTKSRS
jgi:hypothetical protein